MSSARKEKLNTYVGKVKDGLPEKARNVLPKITNYHRNLLAVRGYVKFGDRMDRWPFSTNKEEEDFKKTQAFLNLEKERKNIVKTFHEKNKKHKLECTSESRPLMKQIKFWNNNTKVLKLGQNLETKALREIRKKSYPLEPTDKAVTSFEKWLDEVSLTAIVDKKTYHSPSHATPGLSSHGRVQAIDFLVYKGNKKVAGAVTKTANEVWDKPGWSKKLKEAIEDVSSNWKGPLKNPYEPWHFTYTGT